MEFHKLFSPLAWLLNWTIRRVGSLQKLVDYRCSAREGLEPVGSV
jgi:hypothetical protein